MTEEQHIFKKIEQVGDRVLRLAAVELCNEIIENRYKSAEIIDFLGSTRVFAVIARYKKMTPHKNDPGDKGHSKLLSNAYEYSIGALYYENKVKAIETAKADLAHFYENQEIYFVKKQA
ncbi:hypothetical protein FAM09_16645 [Niastella caeni]|uniref:Uncharacterized protein n=1 Tax=Niastella caeni TaxID=2569763 RepID=A0A4S8HW77_9BACT|nr:hypothetical protein [Niastella caeni]THU38304.1 hypothetical protein FAM09_16645 [Niastella caeni]